MKNNTTGNKVIAFVLIITQAFKTNNIKKYERKR